MEEKEKKSKFNERTTIFIFIELFLLAAILGFSFNKRAGSGGWWVFAVTLIALLVLSLYPKIQGWMSVGFSLFWGLAAYNVARSLFDSLGTCFAIAGVAFVISFALHHIGFKSQTDKKY